LPIDPWEALRVTVRAAHLLDSPIKGAQVELDGTAQLKSGLTNLYAVRSAGPGGKYNRYTISPNQSAFRAGVFWLPWAQGRDMGASIASLERAGAYLFLTAGLSGCHFVACDGAIVHTDAMLFAESGLKTIDDVLEDDIDPTKKLVLYSADNPKPFEDPGAFPGATATYGVKGAASRAIVMGWRSADKGPWFFAYQDVTPASTQFGLWKPLRV
jgi:hypothetical protein